MFVFAIFKKNAQDCLDLINILTSRGWGLIRPKAFNTFLSLFKTWELQEWDGKSVFTCELPGLGRLTLLNTYYNLIPINKTYLVKSVREFMLIKCGLLKDYCINCLQLNLLRDKDFKKGKLFKLMLYSADNCTKLWEATYTRIVIY